jgi:hypothetical protein
MTHPLVNPVDRLLTALSQTAEAALGSHQLVSVEFEQVAPREDWSGEVSVTTLKASVRICFLSAVLTQGEDVVFKAGAVFKSVPVKVQA